MNTTPVMVSRPRRYVDRGQPAISATIEADGRRHEIFYRVSQGPLSVRSDAFLAVALLPAMRLGAPLHVEGTVSARLLQNLLIFQDIFCTWFKDFHRITIEAQGEDSRAEQPPSGVACFFSGGIDSSYSVLKHSDELTHLIFVYGFDIGLHQEPLRTQVAQAMHEEAAELGKPLIEVETNLRSLLDLYGDWDLHTHGAALASVALAQAQFKKVYIASSYSYDRLLPLATHPLLDHLWSTEQMGMVHDGCEATRWQKMEYIMNNAAVQRWLRVCWHNDAGSYNCGRCKKCARVMGFLRIVGLASKFRTFPPLQDVRAVAAGVTADPITHIYLAQLLEYAESHHGDPEMVEAMRSALAAPVLADGDPSDERIDKQCRRIRNLEGQLHDITASRSWRLTVPLREASKLGGRVKKALSR